MAFQYVHFIVSLLVLILVGFIGFAVKNLMQVTASLKNVFDSMNTSAKYLKSVQEIAKSLYDPSEIEKIVNLRVEAATKEAQSIAEKGLAFTEKFGGEAEDLTAEIKAIKEDFKKFEAKSRQELNRFEKKFKSDFVPLAQFVFAATTVLPADYLDHTIRIASKEGNPELLNKIVQLAQEVFAKKGYKLPVKIEGFR